MADALLRPLLCLDYCVELAAFDGDPAHHSDSMPL